MCVLLFNVAETICNRDLYGLSIQVKKYFCIKKVEENDQALQNLLCLICVL